MSLDNDSGFYTPQDIEAVEKEIAEVYIEAFAGPPWGEVSICASDPKLCVGGMSSLAVGSLCSDCGLCPQEPAYTVDGLLNKFDGLASLNPVWYIEKYAGSIALCALSWQSKANQIASRRYADNPEMFDWMTQQFNTEPIIWLDEVFADKRVRPSGNLRNFNNFVKGFTTTDCKKVAFRTITPQMVAAANKSGARVYKRNVDVPDRRDFVVLDMGKK